MAASSILDGRPGLAAAVHKIAEVAGYLWERGWAERNGGNITLNVGEFVDDAIRRLPAISGPHPIGLSVPLLRGGHFFCKGTNRRMRDLSREPMRHGSVIRICDDCESYEIVADEPVKPTSELRPHLLIHNSFAERGNGYKAIVHTHPIELVAMSHNPRFLERDALTRILWGMIPETRAFCPKGLGIVRYELPGSAQLARATLAQLADYDVVLWEKHGVVSVSHDVEEAFDMVDTLSKSALIYVAAKNMGFEPTGMSARQMNELKVAFNLDGPVLPEDDPPE